MDKKIWEINEKIENDYAFSLSKTKLFLIGTGKYYCPCLFIEGKGIL